MCHTDYSLVYYFVIWFILITVSLGFIYLNGILYVSWPRLNPPLDAIHYDGPGFREGRRGFGKLIKETMPVKPRRRANSRMEELEIGNIKKRLD